MVVRKEASRQTTDVDFINNAGLITLVHVTQFIVRFSAGVFRLKKFHGFLFHAYNCSIPLKNLIPFLMGHTANLLNFEFTLIKLRNKAY